MVNVNSLIMRMRKFFVASMQIAVLTLLLAAPCKAQVDKVVADVEGITCPSCAALMEYALMKLDGIDKVTISMERQQFVVFYKLGASFQPKLLREAVSKSGVKVRKFQLQVIGTLKEQKEGRTFNSGKDLYSIASGGPDLPLNAPIYASADVLDDTQIPYKLKVLSFKALPKPANP